MKKILTALLAVCILTGCASQPASSQDEKRIGILSSIYIEMSLLLEEAEIDHVDTYGGIEFHVGTLHGKPVVIMNPGHGKVMAASSLTAMLNNYQISEVIFTGIAGAVGDETQVLDVVIGDRLVQHDRGTITNEGFVWTGRDEEQISDAQVYFSSDPALVDLAYQSAENVVGKNHVFKGVVASGDQFVDSEEYVQRLQKDFDAIACESGGAAVAEVCTNYEVPFVVIRAMSDKADGKGQETFENMGNLAAAHSFEIVLEMLDAMK